MKNDVIGALAMSLAGVLVLLLGMILGQKAREHAIMLQALATGHAEYVITNKSTGATEFRFKEVK